MVVVTRDDAIGYGGEGNLATVEFRRSNSVWFLAMNSLKMTLLLLTITFRKSLL
ncbi:hypothetical protein CASFOL_020484 [Castilleja foliolosa]|uniref:Uncharacterized protein n=1 Tax=Castilleja foliolosa TaxID=1961234 RepID=A0ABD3D1S6_9LAMI